MHFISCWSQELCKSFLSFLLFNYNVRKAPRAQDMSAIGTELSKKNGFIIIIIIIIIAITFKLI